MIDLRRNGRAGFIPFLTHGFPTPADTPRLLAALASAGADAIELGVPFSDPLADGPTIQRASWRALEGGVTLEGTLDLLGEIAGGGGYFDLAGHTLEVEVFGLRCLCLDLDTLIRVKRAAGRPRDFEVIAELTVIRDELDR